MAIFLYGEDVNPLSWKYILTKWNKKFHAEDKICSERKMKRVAASDVQFTDSGGKRLDGFALID